MFEQSTLLAVAAGRKTGALFASFLAQIAAVGVLIVVPLIFHDTLPGVRLSLPAPFILASLPKPPEHQTAKASPQSARPSIVPREFRPLIAERPATPQSPAIAFAEIDAPPGVIAGYAPQGTIFDSSAPVSLPPPIEKPTAATTAPAPPKPNTAPLPIGGDVQSAKLIKKVFPIYPQPARQLRISGTVRLMGVIGKDGTIQKLQVISGNPFLARAALEAVQQWIYRPTLLNGQPVEVIAPIDVTFTLTP